MGPPLSPGPLGLPYRAAQKPPRSVIELFHDLNCPFSKKMMMTLQEVVPAIEEKYLDAVQWLFMGVIQPWHAQSCLMHSAALAVADIKPDATWKYFWASFDKQERFFDDTACTKSQKEVHE